MNDECEIEFLPTIGEAFSFKTRKQGRLTNRTESMKSAAEFSITENRLHRKGENFSDKTIELTCHNILKHPKASQKQKDLASSFLNGKNTSQTCRLIILGIGKTLNRYK